MKIGYVPWSSDLRQPTDRRRFCSYARRRGLSFELATPDQAYDVVVVTEAADFSVWSRYPRSRGRIVFDLIDSYLSVPEGDLKGRLRGTAKFLVRQSRYWQPSFTKAVQEMCRRADAVVCSTPEQKDDIRPYCGNVHDILDLQDDSVRVVKSDYRSRGEVFNFVWEGLGSNVRTFRVLRDAFREVGRTHRFAVHLVTSLRFAAALRNLGRVDTSRIARRVFEDVPVFLYEWNEDTVSAVCSACDVAVIPIPLEEPIYRSKPENKLLFFWRLGLPTVTSATPAYTRAMQECGLSLTCRTTDEWVMALDRLMRDEASRRAAGEKGSAFVSERHSVEATLRRWDAVFESMGR